MACVTRCPPILYYVCVQSTNLAWVCQWTDSKSKFLIDFFTWRHGGHICVQNNESATMFVYNKNPVGIELFSHIKTFFYSKQFAKLQTTWLKTIFYWESFNWRAFHHVVFYNRLLWQLSDVSNWPTLKNPMNHAFVVASKPKVKPIHAGYFLRCIELPRKLIIIYVERIIRKISSIWERSQYQCLNNGKDSFVRGIDPNTVCTSNYYIW